MIKDKKIDKNNYSGKDLEIKKSKSFCLTYLSKDDKI